MNRLLFNSLVFVVSSITGTILTFIETSVEAALPSIAKSKHYYDLNKNDAVKNGYVYSVTPGSGSNVPGTLRHVTIEQDFEITISRDYIENTSNDINLRTAVDSIYQDNETIIREIALRKTTVANVLRVAEPSFTAPIVNENQKSVSVTFTYPITYRKPIKGDL